MRSIKSKIDKTLQEEMFPKRRIDIICHDNILFNLYANSHVPQYTFSTDQELRFFTERLNMKLQKLPRIQLNDPLLLYYGFPPFSVITSRQCSEITASYRVDYLYIVPQFNETTYNSHVIINY
jgi:DNA-directed RNA polymerase subunit H (RpoH/RPB5)